MFGIPSEPWTLRHITLGYQFRFGKSLKKGCLKGYSSLAFPIVHSSIDFKHPLFCGNKLLVILRPQQLGIDKFEINYEILTANTIVSKAITRHICIEISTKRKHKLPNQIRQWLFYNHGDKENREINK